MTKLSLGVALALMGGAVGSRPASAQPSRDDKSVDKGDAKALLASGLKLFAAKDYLGALSVFQTAYARFPNGKILLNIGTTLVKLDRKAEAANAYQGYLDTADVDAAKKAEVEKVLADLDTQVGLVEISVKPADAEVQLDSGEWQPAAKLARVRVAPGGFTVRARKVGFKDAEQTGSADKGTHKTVSLVLAAEVAASTGAGGNGTAVTPGGDFTGIRAGAHAEAAPGRLGLMALAHVDPSNKGAAAVVGISYDLGSRLQLQAAALLGPSSGAYAGARVALLPGKVKPLLAAGVPLFVANGARIGVRGAGGIEVELSRHLALVAELGVEHVFNAETSIEHTTMFVPSAGFIGRL